MKPYYEDADATLYFGDAREVLPLIPKRSVDLIVTDPPYGQDWQSGRRTESFDRIHDDATAADVPGILLAALGNLRPFRHVYVFGPALALDGLPIGGQAELVWDKGLVGSGDLSSPWGPQHEPITFGVYVPSAGNRARGDGRLAARLRKGSVLRVDRRNGTAVRLHPTEKPVELLRQLIESSSLLGEVVLDPFVGVGSTMLAAKAEGRRSIGIEIDERYCATAAERLSRFVAHHWS